MPIPPKVLKEITRPLFSEVKKVLGKHIDALLGIAQRGARANGVSNAEFKAMTNIEKARFLPVLPEGTTIRDLRKQKNIQVGKLLGDDSLLPDERVHLMQARDKFQRDLDEIPNNLVKSGKFTFKKAGAQVVRKELEASRLSFVPSKTKAQETEELMGLQGQRVKLQTAFTKGEIAGDAYKVFDDELQISIKTQKEKLGIITEELF